MNFDDARKGLAGQPFSVLVGARLMAFGSGEAVIEIDARDDLRQQNGYLHGGVVAYAADNTLTFAAGSVLGPALLTAGFSIDYVRPAGGRTLRAEARVVQSSGSRATCRCDVYSDDELCAVAQGTAVKPTGRRQ
ncbi:PaaI family thioesterase [Kibdelosporangium philippinense]|uniref:Medium/long-chain acyl-CoA thioesterase YigI n=1 Tax=Kibdelosporangium philippinense TaxID=211113 RepID=A0ABS8Z8R1_9PSEU|nr:PaaI family thioesterase [Kibdelosporangium philippinense]MCE7004205.1 PaaI family thioesterase [Kibdelosporangium philippinense]